MKRVIVTGATGFIGSRFVTVLANRGVEVVALTRGDIPNLPAGATTFRGDLTDPATIRGVATGADAIVHLAGLSHRMGSGPTPAQKVYDSVNVGAANAIIEEARRAGVRKVLFMSSTSAACRESDVQLVETLEPRPQDAYGRSKLRAEMVIREAGTRGDLWTAAIRPPMVYGPGNKGNLPRLMRLVRKGVPLPLGAVKNRRSIVYIENLMHAMNLALHTDLPSGEVFYVADAAPLSTPDLIRAIGRAVGRKPILLPVPPGMMRLAGRIGDRVAAVAGLPFTSQEVMRLVGSLYVDDSKLRAACGYAPPFTTDEGLRAMADSIYGAPSAPNPGDQ